MAFDRGLWRQRKRTAVLSAAAAAFNRRGFANTSMDEVASSLGLSKAAIYQYFRSKQEILYECQLLAVTHAEAAISEGLRTQGSGLEKLLVYLVRYLQGFLNDLGACSVLIDISSLGDEQRAEIQSRRHRIASTVESFIALGIEDGSIVNRHHKLTALFIFGALNWMSIWYRPDGAATPVQIVETFSSLVAGCLANSSSNALIKQTNV